MTYIHVWFVNDCVFVGHVISCQSFMPPALLAPARPPEMEGDVLGYDEFNASRLWLLENF